MTRLNALLVIDAQYDFCNRSGSLYVNGADADMKRLSDWIKRQKDKIDHIILTMDNHQVNDISHPSFWLDMSGNFPAPFTPISSVEIEKGTWRPRFYMKQATRYVKDLEKQGEYGHFIWPYHCLTGSRGAALNEDIIDALKEWSDNGNYYEVVVKGTYPLTEHFGIFRANIPVRGRPETQLNKKLINKLKAFSNVYVAGEARSHCVANSIKQAMDEAPELARRFIIIDDCMSDVSGLGHLGTPIFERAKKMGIRFAKSTDLEISPKDN
jgi:nicotinamidase-related amidase